MGSRLRPAREVASWRGADALWLDHATLSDDDEPWLAPVRSLTLWAVRTPPGLLARLPALEWLDVRGGSGDDAALAAGCQRLRYLAVNQVRGLTDLSVLPGLTTLEAVSLYGLPRVTAIPSLAPLTSLARAEIGSMKGLTGLTGLHDAPALAELQLIRAVGLAPDDAERLRAHPSLRCFYWFAEDVPLRVWKPFVTAVGKPRPPLADTAEWLRRRPIR